MSKYLEVEGLGHIEFPDSDNDEDILAYAQTDDFWNELIRQGIVVPDQSDKAQGAWDDLVRGIDNLQSTGYGLIGLLGDKFGSEDIRSFGLEGYQKNIEEASQRSARVGSFTNIKGLGDAAVYAIEAVAENIPMFLPGLALGGIGGVVGGQLAKKAATKLVEGTVATLAKDIGQEAAEQAVKQIVNKRIAQSTTIGALSGVEASSVGIEAGSIYGNMQEELKQTDANAALGGGIAAGTLDAIPTFRILKRIFGPSASEAIWKRIAKAGAETAMLEAPTELAQTIIERGTLEYIDPNYNTFSEKGIIEMADAFIKGGIAGGTIGAGAEAISSPFRSKAEDKEKKIFTTPPEVKLSPSELDGTIFKFTGQDAAERDLTIMGMLSDGTFMTNGGFPVTKDQVTNIIKQPQQEVDEETKVRDAEELVQKKLEAKKRFDTIDLTHISSARPSAIKSIGEQVKQDFDLLPQEESKSLIRKLKAQITAYEQHENVAQKVRSELDAAKAVISDLEERLPKEEKPKPKTAKPIDENAEAIREELEPNDFYIPDFLRRDETPVTTEIGQLDNSIEQINNQITYEEVNGENSLSNDLEEYAALENNLFHGYLTPEQIQTKIKSGPKTTQIFKRKGGERDKLYRERRGALERYSYLRNKFGLSPIKLEEFMPQTLDRGGQLRSVVKKTKKPKDILPTYKKFGRVFRGVPALQANTEYATLDKDEIGTKTTSKENTEIFFRGKADYFFSIEGDSRIGMAFKASDKFIEEHQEVVNVIKDIVNKITNGKANLEIFDKAYAVATEGRPDLYKINGWQIGNVVSVALGNVQDPYSTAFHESWHWVVDEVQLLNTKEKEILENALPELSDAVAKFYSLNDAQMAKLPKKEIFAHAAGHYMAAKLRGEPNPFTPRPSGVFEKVHQFFKRIAKAIRHNTQIKTWEDVFDNVASGEVVGRYLASKTKNSKSLTDIIEKPIDQRDPISNVNADMDLKNATIFFENIVNQAGDIHKKLSAPEEFKDLGIYSKIINSPRHLAQIMKNTAFAVYFSLTKDMLNDRTRIAAEATSMITDFGRATPKVKEHLNKVFELAALQGGKHETAVDGHLYVVNDGQEESGKQATLTKPGEVVVLTPDVAKVYFQVQDALKFVFRQIIDAYKMNNVNTIAKAFKLARGVDFINPRKSVGFMHSPDIRALAERVEDTGLKETLMRLANRIGMMEGHLKNVYAPLRRWGDIGIVVKDQAGNVIDFQTYERKIGEKRLLAGQAKEKAEAIANDLRKKYSSSEGYTVEVVNMNKYQTIKDYFSIEGLFDVDSMMIMLSEADQEMWESIRPLIEEKLQTRGFGAHLAKKKKIPGYSTDFPRAIGAYIYAASGYASRIKYSSAIAQQLEEVKETNRDLYKFAKEHYDYIRSPSEEYSALRTFNFAWYLGGNMASAAIQTVTLPQLTFAYLSQFAPAVVVAKELTLALKDTIKALKGVDPKLKLGKLNELFDIKNVLLFKDAARNPEEADAILKAVESGELTPLQTLELVGLNMSESLVRWGKPAKYLDAAQRALAIGFNIFESASRLAGFLTAYRLLQNPTYHNRASAIMGRDTLWRATEDGLSRFDDVAYHMASYSVEETFALFSRGNRPKIMRGMGAPIFQFKFYPLVVFELITRLARKAVQPGEGQKASAKALLMMVGMLGLFGGFWGLPGFDDIREIIELLYKYASQKDIDLDKELREMVYDVTGSNYAAEFLSRGGFRDVGVSIEKRVNLGTVPQLEVLRAILSGGDRLGDVLGVPWSMFIDLPTSAWLKGTAGRTLEATLDFTPLFIKNIGEATLVWPHDGVSSRNGRLIVPPEDLTPLDLFYKFYGFSPAKIARAREADRAITRIGTQDKTIRSNYSKQIAKDQVDVIRAQRKGDGHAETAAKDSLRDTLDEARKHGIMDRALLQSARQRVRQTLNPTSPATINKRVPKRHRQEAQGIKAIYGFEE